MQDTEVPSADTDMEREAHPSFACIEVVESLMDLEATGRRPEAGNPAKKE